MAYAVLLVGLIREVSVHAALGRGLLKAASDLNLEAHGRLLDKLDEIERHLRQMPKMRQPWED